MEKIISRTKKYSGTVMSINALEIDFGNGKKGTFERMEFKIEGIGVMIVALDKKNNIYLIRQFQAGPEKRLLVLPRGGVKNGVKPEIMAKIELEEEIGITASKILQIGLLEIFPGYVKAQTILFLATELTPKKSDGDEMEDIEVVKMPLEEAVELCITGKISDARTIAGILMVNEYLIRHPRG